MSERAPLFGQDPDLDLSDFKPKPPAKPEEVRGVAERAGFRSREPAAATAGTGTAPSAPNPSSAERRELRRYRTGRNVQLNLKVRQEAMDAFYKLADAQGWVLGETFERAVEALERELQKVTR
jgi:hypothetical protein